MSGHRSGRCRTGLSPDLAGRGRPVTPRHNAAAPLSGDPGRWAGRGAAWGHPERAVWGSDQLSQAWVTKSCVGALSRLMARPRKSPVGDSGHQLCLCTAPPPPGRPCNGCFAGGPSPPWVQSFGGLVSLDGCFLLVLSPERSRAMATLNILLSETT